ncbi:unnamed protein product [Gadus morhua 'NCC']
MGSDFFSPAQDTDFQQHPGLYTRPNYADQPFSCTTDVQDGALPPRGHVHDAAGRPSPFTGGRDEQSSPVQMTGPRTCGQEQNTKSQNGIQAKLPAVVYPWMKKVHVTTVNPDYTGSEPKRSRTAYTRQQVLELEKEFHFNRSAAASLIQRTLSDLKTEAIPKKIISDRSGTRSDCIRHFSATSEGQWMLGPDVSSDECVRSRKHVCANYGHTKERQWETPIT